MYYGTYYPSAGSREELIVSRVLAEICTAFWIVGIVFAAWTASFPYSFALWIWVLGMAVCIPASAKISSRRDSDTTICREMIYFFRQGPALLKIVFWMITLPVACCTDSERGSFISQVASDLLRKSFGIRSDTAYDMARERASKCDRHCDAIEAAATYVSDGAGELSTEACRAAVLVTTLTGVAGSMAHAQTAKPVTSIFMARMGENLQAPHTGTYHLLEFLQVRGKWIAPDLGYVDFATNNYHEFFIGGGRTFLDGKKVTLIGEGYFVQATGPDAESARYVWINPILTARLTPKLTGQASYFPYIPLNSGGRFQQVLERAKLDYALTDLVKVGGGYGMYEKAGSSAQHKPFVSVTLSTKKAGSMEFWLQHVPAGAQVQARYFFAHTSH
jgi:hypothetical protein